MGISPHQVVSNANSKLCQVALILDDTATPTPERMRRITALCDDFRRAVAGATADPFRGRCDRHPGRRDGGCAECRMDRAFQP
jgi:hypothetical protein